GAPPPAPTDGREAPTVERSSVIEIGTIDRTQRVVFVLDTSSSMKIVDRADVRSRLERLVEAMEKAIRDLPAGARFTILTFATSVRGMGPDLLEASARNKEQAIEFARGMKADGYTV